MLIWLFLIIFMYSRRDIISFELIILFAIFNLFIFSNHFLQFHPTVQDAAMYHQVATDFAKGLRVDPLSTMLEAYKIRHAAYTVPLGIVYFIFGTSDSAGRFLSALLGLGVVANLHTITQRLFGVRPANIVGILFCLNPFFWFMSCVVLRDMAVCYFITLFFRELLENSFSRNTSLKNYVKMLFIMFYAVALRPPLIFIFSLSFMVWLIYPGEACRGIKRLERYLLIVVFLVAGGTVLLHLLHSEVAKENLLGRAVGYVDIDVISKKTSYNAMVASSSYMGDTSIKTYRDLITRLPLATIYFVASPFPWECISAKQLLGVIDSFHLLIIYFLSFFMLRRFYKQNRKLALPFLIFLVVGIAASSVLHTNVGAAIRHRIMFTFILYPFAAAQIARMLARSPGVRHVALPLKA